MGGSEWLRFFLKGVAAQAADAVDRAERLSDLREKYRESVRGNPSRAGEVITMTDSVRSSLQQAHSGGPSTGWC